jgi:hypothetical protein
MILEFDLRALCLLGKSIIIVMVKLIIQEKEKNKEKKPDMP